MSSAAIIPYATTLLIRDSCLCLHVQRAARSLARRFDEALRPLELTNGQFSLLVSLNRTRAPAMTAVSSLLAMDRTTLTAALKPLARRGLVSISADPQDRRNRLLRLTLRGRRLLGRAVPIWQRTHLSSQSLVGGSNAGRLRGDLRALC